MAQTLFAKAFVNKAKKTFNDAKKYTHRTGNSFGPAPIPDGTYTAVITAQTSVPNKGKMEGIPIVRIVATVNEGQYEGIEPNKTFFCEGKPIDTAADARPTAEQELLGLLQWLLPDTQIDEVEQVPDALELLNERGPVCLIGIKNTKSDAGKEYQNLYLNKVIKASSFEEDTDSIPDSDTGEADSDDPEYVPAKDDVVMFDDEEWTVTAVSQSRQTVNLTNDEGTRKNGIAWDDVTLV